VRTLNKIDEVETKILIRKTTFSNSSDSMILAHVRYTLLRSFCYAVFICCRNN